jgi:hypothetical protein
MCQDELQRLALRGYQESTTSPTEAFKERLRGWLVDELREAADGGR